ncbi:hypothetical protein CLOM_g10278 [Closterium sp. NIES-68]|nr:hypothetical protein CLOM_g10278 [Closterium sp. NIES-68]GJP78158.1 hypothetical protein CLOP_g8490 [Closterium sp. NIES-67]
MDEDAAVCPIPAIDWRFVQREELARLAQQGLVVAAAGSANHRMIRSENELRRRRLRHVVREASAELAREVAEWRSQSYRHPDSQAVAVLAAERHQRSLSWSAESLRHHHPRNLSCSDLMHIGCDADDSRDGATRASEARDNDLETAANIKERAQPTGSRLVAGPPSDSLPGRPSHSARGSDASRHQRGVSLSVLLPELCPFPPVDWRQVVLGSPLPSNHDRDISRLNVLEFSNKCSSLLDRT